MVSLPDGDLSSINLKAWGDAVLKHGPKMAKLVKFCDKLPQPLMTADGKSWSYSLTRNEIAKHAYENGNKHPELAAFCFEHLVKEEVFDKALAILEKPVPQKNLPEITIDGKAFGMKGAVFRKLANDDFRGLFLGGLTDCCQSIGSNGAACAQHGFTSPDGGFYVVETASGEVVGQTWAWRGEKGELCFDSLETLGSRIKDAQWQRLVTAFADALQKTPGHNVKSLHVGTGGETPKSIAKAFNEASAHPRDYNGYRDSKNQVRVWKKKTSPLA